jgi:microcystin-dependent protein
MGPGRGPGLFYRRLGEKHGAERVTLNGDQLPAHVHGLPVEEEFTINAAVNCYDGN